MPRYEAACIRQVATSNRHPKFPTMHAALPPPSPARNPLLPDPSGIIKAGEDIEIVGLKDTIKSTVTGVEMFKKSLGQGQAGDNVGLLVRGIKREDVSRGQVMAKPGSIKTYKVGAGGGARVDAAPCSHLCHCTPNCVSG